MRKALVRFLTLSLVCAALPLYASTSSAQSLGALERGYRTGYSDGFVSGYRDTINHAPYNFRNNQDFLKADRAYDQAYGRLDDYRDGYQQGFSVGYDDGFQNRAFNSTIPKGITPKGTVDDSDGSSDSGSNPNSGGSSTNGSSTSGGNGPVGPSRSTIPANTVLVVEMLDDLTTERAQKGDRFQARVVEPAEFEGATLDGHVEKVQRAGKVKGSAQLQLSFDSIRIDNGGDSRINAQVVEVIPMNPGDKTESVDTEGGVKGKVGRTADVIKVGLGTAVGAVIGAITGGGKGAAIGAAIGGGATSASVLTSRGSDIRLQRGQQLRVRTNGTTQLY